MLSTWIATAVITAAIVSPAAESLTAAAPAPVAYTTPAAELVPVVGVRDDMLEHAGAICDELIRPLYGMTTRCPLLPVVPDAPRVYLVLYVPPGMDPELSAIQLGNYLADQGVAEGIIDTDLVENAPPCPCVGADAGTTGREYDGDYPATDFVIDPEEG